MNQDSDDYLAFLASRERQLDAEDADADLRQQEIERGRQARASERAEIAAARAHYEKFQRLQSGGDVRIEPAAARLELIPHPPTVHNVPRLRVGPQRKQILEQIARLNEAGRVALQPDIVSATDADIDLKRVRNVFWEDAKRGLLERRGDGVVLTEAGAKFLRQIGVAFEMPSAVTETPEGQ